MITVSKSGHAAGYVWWHDEPIWASDSIAIRSKDEFRYLSLYLYLCLKAKQDEIYLRQQGTTLPHIYVKHIRDFPVACLGIERAISDSEGILFGTAWIEACIGKNNGDRADCRRIDFIDVLKECAIFETVIIRHLFESERYMRTVLPHLKPRYFDENHRAVFLAIAKYVAEFQKPPTSTIIRCEFANSNDNWSLSTTQGKLLEEIFSEGVELIQDIDWLICHTEKWCQDRAVYMALIESVDIIESGRNETSRIPELLRKALSVEFNPSVGHEYRSRSADRWNECHNESDRSRIFEFDIDQLNEITNGGVSPKTLNIVMSGPGGGKSLFMTHCAAHPLSKGTQGAVCYPGDVGVPNRTEN